MEGKNKYIGAEKKASSPLPPARAGRARSRGPRPAPPLPSPPPGDPPPGWCQHGPRPRGACGQGRPPQADSGSGPRRPGKGRGPYLDTFFLAAAPILRTFQAATSCLRE